MVSFVSLVLLVAAASLPSADCRAEGAAGQNTQTLLQRRITISVTNTPVSDFVKSLRKEHRVPVSFIDAGAGTGRTDTLTLDLKDAAVSDVLDRVVAALPAYRWEVLEGHLVLYPDVAKYRSQVRASGITGMKRMDAVNAYLSQLRAQQPDFANLFPFSFGNLAAPIFSDPVTLTGDSTVLRHFVGLLGEDQGAVFSIVTSPGGPPMFLLNKIQ